MSTESSHPSSESRHFIEQIIEEDLASGKHAEIVTRFPPEPNGRLHIGHAKAINISFGLARQFGGRCHLRFDDTNPEKEETHFVEAIQEDIRWLGWDWGEHLYHASDYYPKLYEYAVDLIRKGLAYVCTLGVEAFKEYRGVPTRPGKHSPHRDRPVEESLDLFERMKAGEFADGEYVLRAKIDMASPNLHLRDPIIYRIKHAEHHRTGDAWCIYPMYDFAHGQSDALEGITHSLCSLEFEVHRPLYEWFLEHLDVPHHPRQIEFARLKLGYTVMSKRRLTQLVEEGTVRGWDDPRMPTLSGMRRRGYSPESINTFCHDIGVTKFNSMTDISKLESCVREDLNKKANRYMGVLNPLKVVITNYPEGEEEFFEAINNPEDPSAGTRQVGLSREIYIEREDFMEDPPKKFFRLGPGREVRLRYACYITCNEVIKDAAGEVTELHCSFDPESRGASTPDGRKVKGTLHWVSAAHAARAEVRIYDRLFTVEDPMAEGDEGWKATLNPDSMKVLEDRPVEPVVQTLEPGTSFQFERLGYFCVDPDGQGVLNRTVPLRDTWAKQQAKG